MPNRKAIWKSKDQFNHTSTGAPVSDKVEIIGENDDAYLALISKGRPTDNIDFSTPAEYTYDDTKVQILGDKASLKATVAGDGNWPFTTPGNYAYDPNKIEVVGGVAKLVGTPLDPYVWWHLNESYGTVVHDSSGNGNDATLIAMEDGDWQAGKLNNCLSFNAGGTTDEYINAGQIGGIERTDVISVDFWIKVSEYPNGNIRIIYKYDGTQGYVVYCNLAGNIYLFMLDKTFSQRTLQVRGDTPISLNTWHHVALTYDGSSLASGVEFYMDGQLDTKSVYDDDLTGSLLNPAPLRIGGTGISYFLRGHLDEIAAYNRVLTLSEVQQRYNSGNGAETMPGSYITDNPTVYPVSGFNFGNPLGAFTETVIKPTGSEIKYHVSADAGVTWKYWDGSDWIVTDDTYTQANTVTDVNANINELAGSGIFKFRALLHSDDGQQTPELGNIYIAEGVSYTLIPQEIIKINDIQPAHVYRWLSTAETVLKPAGTFIKYQYSIDGGTIWSGTWLTEPELEAALYALVLTGDGTDTLKIKFQLITTDTLQTPEIDNLAVTYEVGYEDSGSYISTSYYPRTSWVGTYIGKISFDIENFPGTSVVVYARAVNEVLEDNYNQPWTIYNNEDIIGICGYMMQWYVELTTTNPAVTPKLNSLDIEFHPLIGTLRTMDAMVQDTNEKVIRILGLVHENIGMDQHVYTKYQGMQLLTSARLRIYSDPASAAALADTNITATYTVTATWTDDKLSTYTVVKQ